MILRLRPALLFMGGLLALAVLYMASSPVSGTPTFTPTLEITAISNRTPGVNADITFRTTVPAGESFLGVWALDTPLNSFLIAGDAAVNDNYVTAVGTMSVDVGAVGDPDCDGTIETYTFNLRDVQPVEQFSWASWTGLIKTNPDWGMTLDIDANIPQGGTEPESFTIQGFANEAFGVNLCTPQTFTITFCGRANPNAAALVCGSGANPPVMTNPSIAGLYTWDGTFLSDTGLSGLASASVCIAPSADTDADGVLDPCDNCLTVPNPDQRNINGDGLGDACDPDDYDLDTFTDRVEYFAGTLPGAACAVTPANNAWPPDFNNDRSITGSDLNVIASNIGKSVPPAAARDDIAPDPPDGAITGGDLSRVATVIGNTCVTDDQDGDGVLNVNDNCPTIYNPDQRNINPADGVGDACDPDDFDLDLFSDRIEYFAGTLPGAKCAVTPADSAWPPDFNNDRSVTGSDLNVVASNIGKTVPPAAARINIAPDPPDGAITGADLNVVATRIGETCTP